MASTPRLSLPFRIEGAHAAVNERSSLDEIRDCVQTIIRYPQGSRPELPEFGTPDLAFRQGSADPTLIQQAVARWEPRASLEITVSVLDDLTDVVAVRVAQAGGA